MSKHTPGPWRIEEREYLEIWSDAFGYSLRIDKSIEPTEDLTERMIADVYLRAAASELLAECEYWLHDGRFLTANCDEYNEAVDRLVAVIAKAKGEA